MDPTVISVCAALIGIGLVGNMIGAFIRLYLKEKL